MRQLLIAGLFIISTGTLPLAHHGTNASYDPTKEVTLTGTVSKFVWSNPHGQLHFDVKGPDGKVVTWGGELHSIALLRRSGWTRSGSGSSPNTSEVRSVQRCTRTRTRSSP